MHSCTRASKNLIHIHGKNKNRVSCMLIAKIAKIENMAYINAFLSTTWVHSLGWA